MRKDNKVLISVMLVSVLVLLHTWQFIRSDFNIKALVNLAVSVAYIPIVMICGLKAVPLFLACYGLIYIPFESFDNYTSLFLLFSAISINRKLKGLIWVYLIETLICYIIKGFQISHIAITACYIIYMWNVYIIIQNKRLEVEKLTLTDDEVHILNQLLDGKEIKEVVGFSQNTVYKKLRSARERNDCITNDELILRYKNQK